MFQDDALRPSHVCGICTELRHCRTFNVRHSATMVKFRACALCVADHFISQCKPPRSRAGSTHTKGYIAVKKTGDRISPAVIVDASGKVQAIDYSGPARNWKRIMIRMGCEWERIETVALDRIVAGNKL